jgi:uncharacterized protein involved in exopolysaccharide biosynthesis
MQVIQNAQLQIQSVLDGINRNRDRRLVLEQALTEATQTDLSVSPQRPHGGEDASAGSLSEQLEKARALLRQLQSRLTAEHPDVIHTKRLIADLEQKVAAEDAGAVDPVASDPVTKQRQLRVKQLRAELDAIDRQIAASQAEEQRLRAMVGQYQQRVEAAPSRETELTELMRDYSTLQSVYTSLLQKREDSKMAANLERRQVGEQFKLLDAAKPAELPVSPNRLKMVAMASFFGASLGAALAGLLLYRDSSIRTDDDAQRALGLTVLANVPLMLTGDERRRQQWRALGLNAVYSLLVLVCGGVVAAILVPLIEIH